MEVWNHASPFSNNTHSSCLDFFLCDEGSLLSCFINTDDRHLATDKIVKFTTSMTQAWTGRDTPVLITVLTVVVSSQSWMCLSSELASSLEISASHSASS